VIWISRTLSSKKPRSAIFRLFQKEFWEGCNAAQRVWDYESSTIDASRIDDWLRVAGTQIGIDDWRPHNGLYKR
jgi:hypothetical protein